MMAAVRVRSDVFAGRSVTVNDAVIEFAADGTCRGIVAYADGRTQDPPDPLRPQDIAVLQQLPAFTVEPPGEAPSAADQGDTDEIAALVERHTRTELVRMAEERGIAVPERATKRQIAQMLLEAE